MKLRLRNNGIWMLEYHDAAGKRRRVSTGKRERAQAEEEAQRILTGQGKPGKVTKVTLAKVLWDTYEDVWSKQASAREKRYVVGLLARSRLGYMEVGEVTYRVLVSAVSEWLSDEENPVSPATCNRRLTTISKALSEAVDRGLLTAVPKIPYQPEDNQRYRWLTREEELSLLQACGAVLVEDEANAMRALIIGLIDTGARLGEFLRCTQEGKFSAEQAVFTNKKNRRRNSRSVPLTARAHTAMQHLHHWQRDRGPLDNGWCERRFTRVREQAGLDDVVLHTMRHTCLSRLVQGGMDLYRVKDWAGHSSIVVTERYAHLAPSHLVSGKALLEEIAAPALRIAK